MKSMTIIISCAGDTDLASRVLDHFLQSEKFLPFTTKLEHDEIIITDDSIEPDHVHQVLQSFLDSNNDLDGYTITAAGNIFALGILKRIDELIIRCEVCGFLAHHEDELIIHRRMHAIFLGLG